LRDEALEGEEVFLSVGDEGPRLIALGLVERGLELLVSGNVGEARLFLDQAIQVDPECAEARLERGELRLQSGDVPGAEEDFREASRLAASALGLEGEPRPGQYWLDPRTRPRLRALAGLARSHALQDRWEDALSDYQTVLRLNPQDNLAVALATAETLIRLDRFAESDQLLGEEPTDPRELFTSALARFGLGDRVGALLQLRRAFLANGYLAPLLLGLPYERTELFGSEALSDPETAEEYRASSLPLWESVPGAIDFLRRAWQDPRIAAEVEEFRRVGERLVQETDERERRRLRRRQRRLAAPEHLVRTIPEVLARLEAPCPARLNP
jgi:tetratricopeptide (TPR) repeat protein